MAKMVDLELDDEDKLDAIMPMPMAKPDYPFGLRICLCGPEMGKLKLDPTDVKIGDYLDIRAFGEITSVSRERVEIQLQRMSVENETDENEE